MFVSLAWCQGFEQGVKDARVGFNPRFSIPDEFGIGYRFGYNKMCLELYNATIICGEKLYINMELG